MATDRLHGYTLPARYEQLDRFTHKPGCDWSISEVMRRFPCINQIVSLGSGVGINENLLAAQHPDKKIILIDIDYGALSISESGVWSFDNIRPSGLAFDSSDETIIRMLEKYYIPTGEFSVCNTGDKPTVKRNHRFSNMMHINSDNNQLALASSTFDLVLSYMSFNPLHLGAMSELLRVLKDEALYWCENGLFRIDKGCNRFERLLYHDRMGETEYNPLQDRVLGYFNNLLSLVIAGNPK